MPPPDAPLGTPPRASAVGIGWRHGHYAALLEQRPTLDFIEVHSENFMAEGGAALAVLQQARVHYPVSLHGVGLALGSAVGMDAAHLERLAALVARIEPVRVSDHACFARAPLAGGGLVRHAADLLPIPFHRAALDVLCANVQRVQDRLQRPLLVENLSAYWVWASSEQHEADFLAALAQRTGCQLLVDVNNLYVNALNEQISGLPGDPLARATQWLDRIPPHAVGELHLAGHCRVPDPGDGSGEIVIDDHGSRVAGPVWQLYRHAAQRFGAVPALVEWDTDLPSLAVLLDEAATARRIGAEAGVGAPAARLEAEAHP